MKTGIQKSFIIFLILFGPCQPIHSFKIMTLDTVLKQHPEITYQKIYDEISFDIPALEIAPSMPHKGFFKELFILSIPNGIVKGLHGYTIVDHSFIQELIWGDLDNLYNVFSNGQDIDPSTILKIPGKVAVIAQLDPKNYGHFILEILGRLAVLEMGNVDYDYLYVPYGPQPFIQQILELWGIDASKIISPHDNNFAIEAEVLISPSFNIRTNKGYRHGGNFHHPETMAYIRKKLLHGALQKNINPEKFNKKIFISRGDTLLARKIANESEVFELFKAEGFTSYILNNLSVAEQIILFHNADIVVCENGAGLTNILFCKQKAHVIEIFQNFIAMDFWQCAYICNLQYTPVNTLLGDDANFYSDWHANIHKFYSFPPQPIIPLDKIKQLIKTL